MNKWEMRKIGAKSLFFDARSGKSIARTRPLQFLRFQRAQYAIHACCVARDDFFCGETDVRFAARTGLLTDELRVGNSVGKSSVSNAGFLRRCVRLGAPRMFKGSNRRVWRW